VTSTLILWGHALAALLFVAVALALRTHPVADLPRLTLTTALALTALWALTVAGIDPRDMIVRVLVGLRDVAWIAAALGLAGRRSRSGRGQVALSAAVMAVMLIAAAIAVIEAGKPGSTVRVQALAETRLWLRALALLGALLLVDRLRAEAGGSRARRLFAVALTLMWGGDLVAIMVGRVLHYWPADLMALRGGVMASVALLMLAASGEGTMRSLTVSRTVAARLLAVVALAGYAGVVALLTSLADALGGDQARPAQAAIVFGAAAALLTLLSTSWLRGWAKVTLAKHLFSHRYDYRAEWQRFGATLAGSTATIVPLGERVARAIADLTVSPAALLWMAEGEGLVLATGSGWADAPSEGDTAALARHLATTGRIVELDAVRRGTAPAAEAAAVPRSLLAAADAWAIVPLAHHHALVGAVVLARPPVDRALDWEDFDLLRVAGRQAAGALAEDRARRALADAERFDEFNRRFAFILHDIKNLVSQLSLVARNAERHADNPVFRADMVATLTESSGRMQALLAKLSPQASRCEAAQPIEAAPLLAGMATRRHGSNPLVVAAPAGLWLLADRNGLKTVLDHLVQNAADASRPGQPVTLAAAAGADGIAIEVADRGAGMSAAFIRDQLFRPFVSTKPGGFGLGAFEARQMIEAMGGRLEVTSREGEGTRVTLRLPAAPAWENAA
jgi:putative PEP-CTERM system histidine kinase